ncbi:hypothetical protein [Lolliginicoccus suaedae]|uniref:hypothetical protein n=1 Tax=Lolliginicoccus suaedae TaxID=2605429 RepID=UPI0011EE71CE|nr:hypothetical protein [Lolliginicoccus suaedae]
MAENSPGPQCARIGTDGTVTLGAPWPRPYWSLGDVALVDHDAPLALSHQYRRSQVLDDNLLPVSALPFDASHGPYIQKDGPWLARTPDPVARPYRDPAFAGLVAPRGVEFNYFRLDPRLARPTSWATAPGHPKDLAVQPSTGQLWISTTYGLYRTDAGSLETPGSIDMHEVSVAALAAPEVPVVAPPEMGDPDEWLELERARLIHENQQQGLLDVEIDGWFPTAKLIVTFAVGRFPGVVFARRFSAFTRDGAPALWRGAPTLMDHISLDIQESGGDRRLRKREPGAFGYVWV